MSFTIYSNKRPHVQKTVHYEDNKYYIAQTKKFEGLPGDTLLESLQEYYSKSNWSRVPNTEEEERPGVEICEIGDPDQTHIVHLENSRYYVKLKGETKFFYSKCQYEKVPSKPIANDATKFQKAYYQTWLEKENQEYLTFQIRRKDDHTQVETVQKQYGDGKYGKFQKMVYDKKGHMLSQETFPSEQWEKVQ